MGRASAILLGAEGASVVVADWDQAGAESAASEIVAAGGRAIAVVCDVGDSAAVTSLVSRTLAEYGRIDVLMHAAGICPRSPLLEMSDDDWHAVLRVNLDGTFFVTREVGRVMAAQKSGTMILVTSDRGVHGSVDYAHYAASKGGIESFTMTLAAQYANYGIRANAIAPGTVRTERNKGRYETKEFLDANNATPAARARAALLKLYPFSVGEPEDIAALAVFLGSDESRMLTGTTIAADGGRSSYIKVFAE